MKKLKKVAKDCKDVHSQRRKIQKPAEKKNKMMQSIDKLMGDLSSSVNFAATLRKVSAAQHEVDDPHMDMDLDSEESSQLSDTSSSGTSGASGVQNFLACVNHQKMCRVQWSRPRPRTFSVHSCKLSARAGGSGASLGLRWSHGWIRLTRRFTQSVTWVSHKQHGRSLLKRWRLGPSASSRTRCCN